MTIVELEENLKYLREKCGFLSEVLDVMQSFERNAIRFNLRYGYFADLEKHVSDELLRTITELDISEADEEATAEIMERNDHEIN